MDPKLSLWSFVQSEQLFYDALSRQWGRALVRLHVGTSLYILCPSGVQKHHQENLGEKYQETQVSLMVTDSWPWNFLQQSPIKGWPGTSQSRLSLRASLTSMSQKSHDTPKGTAWTSGHNGGASDSEIRGQGALTNGTGQRQRDSRYCRKVWMSEDFRRWLGMNLPACFKPLLFATFKSQRSMPCILGFFVVI